MTGRLMPSFEEWKDRIAWTFLVAAFMGGTGWLTWMTTQMYDRPTKAEYVEIRTDVKKVSEAITENLRLLYRLEAQLERLEDRAMKIDSKK